MPNTKRGINKLADREHWPFRRRKGRGGGREYPLSALPAEMQTAVLLKQAPSPRFACDPLPAVAGRGEIGEAHREALWRNYSYATDKKKDKAARRNAALQAFRQLIDAGEKIARAREIVAQRSGIHPVTIYRSTRRTKGLHRSDQVAALVDRQAGGAPRAKIPAEAWDYFKADYLRPEKPAASACYERLRSLYKDVPSLAAFTARVEREIPRQVLILAREGTEALKRSYPAQQRDHSVFHALEAVNADGHRFDVFARWPDGDIVRPVGVFWQDLYSGKILSFRIDKTENRDSVRLSLGDLVRDFGIPDLAWLDNGRGFACKWLTGGMKTRYRFKIKTEDPEGLLLLLGIKPQWISPYHGQAKPLERAFRDFCEYVAKHPAFSGAYTGNTPTAKPENYGSHAVPLEEFVAVLKDQVRAHNERFGRRSQVCAGRSFDQAFDDSYSKSIIKKATEDQQRLWLLAAEGVHCSRQDGSVSIMQNRFWHESLAQHTGSRVVVRFDPQDLHSAVHIYTLDGRFICTAACILPAGFNDTEKAREHARLLNQNVRDAKQALARERRMTALEAAALLPNLDQPEPPETKLVRPIFARTGTDGDDPLFSPLPSGTGAPGATGGGDDGNDSHFKTAVKLMAAAWDKEMEGRI